MLTPDDRRLLRYLTAKRDTDALEQGARKAKARANLANTPWAPAPVEARGKTWRDPVGDTATARADRATKETR